MFLDGYTGFSKSVQPQLLEIRNLTSSEEDLCPTKLILVGVLKIKSCGQSVAQTCITSRCSCLEVPKDTTYQNQSLQHILAGLFLVVEVRLHVRH